VAAMDILITDILKLSTIDTADINRSEVDMHLLVSSVLEELYYAMGGHNATINVMDLPNALCDERMIRQVWANLISNAIKYSSKKPNPQIEIGAALIDGQTTYYVKDNGTGFSMNKARKLFTAFHRLHSDKDFEGTGVGLALASRIISKHNGRIWAHAKPDEGATFYFCLS
jgi:two-component system sensor histidine kinase/response regulator